MKRSRTRTLLLSGLTAGLFAVPVTATAQDDGPTITRPTHATVADTEPARTYTAPFLAVHPDDPALLYGATANMTTKTCHLIRSTDGGRTWTLLSTSPSPPEYPFCTHNTGMATQHPLAIGGDGTIYYAHSGYDGREGEGSSANMDVFVSRSEDGGASWSSTLIRSARGNEGEATDDQRPTGLTVHPEDPEIVYVAFKSRLRQVDGRPTRGFVAVSQDGGETFGEPFRVPGDERNVGFSGIVDVDVAADGTMYATSAGAGPEDGGKMLVTRSTDMGATLTVTDASPESPSGFIGTQITAWSPMGGDAGTLHIVFEDKPDQPAIASDRDIYYTRSTDGGENWSAPTLLNDDDSAELFGNFNPTVSVAPNGRVDVAWWDFRDGAEYYANDVYYTYSDDNGETWSRNLRISDRSINRRLGPWSNGFDVRAPVGLVSADEIAYFGWDDTREGDAAGQAQSVFTAAAQYEPLPAPGDGSVLRYVIGGLAGLTLAGLVLLLFGMRARPGREPAAEKQPVHSGSPAA